MCERCIAQMHCQEQDPTAHQRSGLLSACTQRGIRGVLRGTGPLNEKKGRVCHNG